MMPFKQLTAHAVVLMCCLPGLAAERAATTLKRDGWTIVADSNQARLTHHYPEVLDLKVNAEAGIYDVIAVPNSRTAPVTKTVSFSEQLGLAPGQACIAFDVWNHKLLGVFTNRLTLSIAGHDTRLVLLHPRLNRPQLVATSRHITGSFSVRSLAWNDRRKTLAGTAEVVPGDEYTLFIHLPHGNSFHPRSSASAGGQPLQVRQQIEADLLSVAFKAQQSPADWSVRF